MSIASWRSMGSQVLVVKENGTSVSLRNPLLSYKYSVDTCACGEIQAYALPAWRALFLSFSGCLVDVCVAPGNTQKRREAHARAFLSGRFRVLLCRLRGQLTGSDREVTYVKLCLTIRPLAPLKAELWFPRVTHLNS